MDTGGVGDSLINLLNYVHIFNNNYYPAKSRRISFDT